MPRPLPQELPLDPPVDFSLVLARLRRLASADNKALTQVLRGPPRVLERIDNGSTPDFPAGAAILKLLAHVGGDTSGLMITRR